MNETNQRNIFSQLYGLKTAILIAENITGQNAVAKSINYKKLNVESEYSEKDIFEFIVKTQEITPEKLTELTYIAFFKVPNKEYHIRLKT